MGENSLNRFVFGFIVMLLLAFVVSGCGKSEFEQGKELFDKGEFELALPHLEKAKEDGDHFIQAQEMIRTLKVKLEEQAEADCVRRAENFVDMLAQAKTVDTFDKVIQELKSFRCRKLNTKPYVDRAYYRFISYLAEWDAYPIAAEKFCEFTGCEAEKPHVLIREEEVTIVDDEGKETEETIQQEIPIADHETVMKMFKWLVSKDLKNGRWFDRYAKFLYDAERYKESKEAYEAIAAVEGLGYELKSRAKLAAEHLGKGGRKKRLPDENYRFFWIEDVKQKSKLKALRSELDKAKKEKEAAEKKVEAVEGAK